MLGEFENLTKQFNKTNALNGLSFKIYKGVNGLIGPNGAGKTTTIKLILGLIRATTGKAEMFGFDCWSQSLDIRQSVGILYEKAAFYDHLSGLDHLKLMAKLKGVSDPLGESKEILKLVELDNEAQHRRIGSYSAGMRQRIGLAHALLGKPELIILDEPTSNLDPLGRATVIDIINNLRKEEDFSFLISSHILPELEKVCEHVVLMYKGKAIRQGRLTQLLREVTTNTFRVKVRPVESIVKLLKAEDSVKEVTLDDDYLLVVTKDSEIFKRRLPALVSQAHASLEEIRSSGNDLESMFKLAVKGD